MSLIVAQHPQCAAAVLKNREVCHIYRFKNLLYNKAVFGVKTKSYLLLKKILFITQSSASTARKQSKANESMSAANFTPIKWKTTIDGAEYESSIIVPLIGYPFIYAKHAAKMLIGDSGKDKEGKHFQNMARGCAELNTSRQLDSNEVLNVS